MTTTYDEIASQPAALRDIAARFGGPDGPFASWAAHWREAGQPPLVLTGMGASLYALESANALLALRGITSRVIPTSDLLETEGRALDQAYVVVVSQSGESTEIKELLGALPADRVYALTNHPDSTLARSGAKVVQLGVPTDRSVAIVTYSASLAALVLFAAALREEPLSQYTSTIHAVADEIGSNMPAWSRQADDLAVSVSGMRSMTILGWGASIGTAREAALLFKEAARLPAEGMSTSQFRHGAVEIVDNRHVAVILANRTDEGGRDDATAQIRELVALPGLVIVIGQAAQLHHDRLVQVRTSERRTPLGSLADIVPLQLLAVRVADRTGFESGEFRNTTPVIASRPHSQS